MPNSRRVKFTFGRAPANNQRFEIIENASGWTTSLAASAGATDTVNHPALVGNKKYTYTVNIYNSYGSLSQTTTVEAVTAPRSPAFGTTTPSFYAKYGGSINDLVADTCYENIKIAPLSTDGDAEETTLRIWTHKDGEETTKIWEDNDKTFTDKVEKSFIAKVQPRAKNFVKATLTSAQGTSDEASKEINAGYWIRRANYCIFSEPGKRDWMDKRDGALPQNQDLADYQIYFLANGAPATIEAVGVKEQVSWFANGWKRSSNATDAQGNTIWRYYKGSSFSPWSPKSGGTARQTKTYSLVEGETLGFQNSGGGRSLQKDEGGVWFDFAPAGDFYREAIIIATDASSKITHELPGAGNGNVAKIRFEGSWQILMGRANSFTPETGFEAPIFGTEAIYANLAGPGDLVAYLKCISSDGVDFFSLFVSCDDTSRLPNALNNR